jgi:hypothetical protein
MGEAQELLRAARAAVVGSARTAAGPCLPWAGCTLRLAGETLHRPGAFEQAGAGDNPGYGRDGCVLHRSNDTRWLCHATSNEAGFSLTKWTTLDSEYSNMGYASI